MFNRLIPILLSLIFLAGWEVLIFYPPSFFIVLAAIIILLILLALKLNRFRLKDKDFWLLLTPCLSLVIFTTNFLLFLNYKWLQHIVVFLVIIVSYYFLTYLYYFLCRITNYTPLSLESSSSYFDTVSYLFLGIVVYGLINLLNLKLWYLAIVIIIVTFILTYQFFWINKISERNNLFASILISILMIEFFWSISFFPVAHFISGLALAIIYYVIINLSLVNFLEKLNKKIINLYLSVGLVCIFVILLSAKWL